MNAVAMNTPLHSRDAVGGVVTILVGLLHRWAVHEN